MKLTPKSLLRIDRLFAIPYRLISARSFVKAESEGGMFLVIKLMGLGSIVKFASLCRRNGIDTDRLILVTFESHRDLCKLFGFPNCLFIRTDTIGSFIRDCRRLARQSRATPWSLVVDLERCSNAVGLFSHWLSRCARCQRISFEDCPEDRRTETTEVFSVRSRTFEEILAKGSSYLPKTIPVAHVRSATVFVKKILININCSSYLLARRFPRDSFAEFVEELNASVPGLEFHFTGSRSEIGYVGTLVETLRAQGVDARNRAGTLSLTELLMELAGCALFVTGDSGPLHLAAYLGIPTLAIWGPTQPAHFGYDKETNLRHASLRLPCAPCFRDPGSRPATACSGRIDCMKIPVRRMMDDIRPLLLQTEKMRVVHWPTKPIAS